MNQLHFSREDPGSITLTVISAAKRAAADETDEPAPFCGCVGTGKALVGVLFVADVAMAVALYAAVCACVPVMSTSSNKVQNMV